MQPLDQLASPLSGQAGGAADGRDVPSGSLPARRVGTPHADMKRNVEVVRSKLGRWVLPESRYVPRQLGTNEVVLVPT